MHEEARVNKTTKPRMSREHGRKRQRSESNLRTQMEDLGIDGEELSERRRSRSATSKTTKRPRISTSVAAASHTRSESKTPRDRSGLRDATVGVFISQS